MLATAASYALSATVMFVEVTVAALLFAHDREWRGRALTKAILWPALVFAADLALILVPWLSTGQGGVALALPTELPSSTGAMALLSCSLVLVTVALCVRSLLHLSGWAAVYCATTGYALQNLASGLIETLCIVLGLDSGLGNLPSTVLSLCCHAGVYLAAWWLLIRRVDSRGLEGPLNAVTILMLLVVVFGVIGFDLILKYSVAGVVTRRTLLCLRAFHALVCVFVIVAEVELVVVRQLSSEKAVTEHLLAQSERQYRLSRATIGAINARVHDIRHEVLRTLFGTDGTFDRATAAQIVHEVEVYDAPVRTGNEALDVVLTEKSLLCQGDGITLTCVADGRALGFMSAAELYALFGSALDVAVDAMQGLADEGLRSVSLTVRRQANMACVHVESYRDPAYSPSDVAIDGMRAVLDRYDGTLAISREPHTLVIDIMVPRRTR